MLTPGQQHAHYVSGAPNGHRCALVAGHLVGSRLSGEAFTRIQSQLRLSCLERRAGRMARVGTGALRARGLYSGFAPALSK